MPGGAVFALSLTGIGQVAHGHAVSVRRALGRRLGPRASLAPWGRAPSGRRAKLNALRLTQSTVNRLMGCLLFLSGPPEDRCATCPQGSGPLSGHFKESFTHSDNATGFDAMNEAGCGRGENNNGRSMFEPAEFLATDDWHATADSPGCRVTTIARQVETPQPDAGNEYSGNRD